MILNSLIIGNALIIFALFVLATLARIVIMDGYILMPEYKNGRLTLNVVGTLIASGATGIIVYFFYPEAFNSLVLTLIAGFAPGAIIDLNKKVPKSYQELIQEASQEIPVSNNSAVNVDPENEAVSDPNEGIGDETQK